MKNEELIKIIESLEKEIQFLYTDHKRLLSRCESFHDINEVRLKIKHAEESLRLKRRIQYMSLN